MLDDGQRRSRQQPDRFTYADPLESKAHDHGEPQAMFRVLAGRHGHGLRLPLAFIDPILRKVHPDYFSFSAIEDRLVPVYARMAERLACRYG